jgi:hypothetical protein
MTVEKVQFGVQVSSLDRLEGRSSPMVVRTAKKELAVAIDAATTDPDGSRVAGVGQPSDLLRMLRIADDKLSIQDINGTTS